MISMDTDIKQKMAGLKSAMAAAADGKVMKRELSKRLRTIVKPLEAQMKRKVQSLPSKGHPGAGMRQAIARQTRAATRFTGQNMGVSVVQRARGMPRDFRMAGRMFNRQAGWNPTGLGGVKVHQQVRPAQWFDGETVGIRPQAQREMIKALDETAAILAARSK